MPLSDEELQAAYMRAIHPFGFEAASDRVVVVTGLRAVEAAVRADMQREVRTVADALRDVESKAQQIFNDGQWAKQSERTKANYRLRAASLLAPDDPQTATGRHQKVTMYGGSLEVCDTCINPLGFNVRWDQAHPEAETPVTPSTPNQQGAEQK